MLPFYKKANIKKYYTVLLEVGMILSLLIFIALMRVPLKSGEGEDLEFTAQDEIVKMEEIEQTEQEKRPPPPPRPQVPVAVPNNEIIEEEVLNIDAEFNIDEELKLPPPPEQEAEKGQEEEEDFFVVVEQMPELIGGIQSLQQMIDYPDKAKKAGIQGKVIIQFIVNEKGEVEDPQVIRGIGGGCDEEALRVVKQAHFKPGKQRGRPVRVQYSLPIYFKLKT
ncbi:energy transducer TonB [Balneolaceae bacterium YR4-1]|uniref:Energy transducer TonB n=1 Tax=Halalkalibaculum roseum TaxID=2709311 RepID=A0A6M1T5Y7_9BACT|nr:energy transducer TonB [Halalkalibaculum roseum]NGP77395.1 energy transducer TonB [Halalkalibaculum roseum]